MTITLPPLPYDSSAWTVADWAHRADCISDKWEAGSGQLGQCIQIAVLMHMQEDYFARTGEYIVIDEWEVHDCDCYRQRSHAELSKSLPKLRATPKPTEACLPLPTSVIDIQTFDQAAEPEPTLKDIPALTATLTQIEAKPKL